MAKNKKDIQGSAAILEDAASIWDFLTKKAGLDTIFYDRDILDGNEHAKGLYAALGMQKNHADDFGKDLQQQMITSEAFLKAFFECLQPYANMMEGLCQFFERHDVKKGDNAMRIKFDFDGLDEEDFSFDLNKFREAIQSFTRVQSLTGNYVVRQEEIWELTRLFGEHVPKATSNPVIQHYYQTFSDGNLRPIEPFVLPTEIDPGLKEQLLRVQLIWESFIAAAEKQNINKKTFMQFLTNRENGNDLIINGWKESFLATAISDFWPISLQQRILSLLEMFQSLNVTEKKQTIDAFTEELRQHLNRSIIPGDEMQLLEELKDLLNLPVWHKRPELYAAWILSVIDQTFYKYPKYTLHHNDGVLTLPFKATHLASFISDKGPVELWSEAKTQVFEPEGHSRKGNIQPDYTFYTETGRMPENGLAVVEVKQYRKPSTKNFKAALNDYAKGLPYAHIYLVNYMAVPINMKLKHPKRSTPFGHIIPNDPNTSDFTAHIKKHIPISLPKELEEVRDILLQVAQWPIEAVYVDISGSLNTPEYKVFLKGFLNYLTDINDNITLAAIDVCIRQEWTNMDQHAIDSLLALHFDFGTNIQKLLPTTRELLIITDREGLDEIQGMLTVLPKWHVLLYEKTKAAMLVKGSL